MLLEHALWVLVLATTGTTATLLQTSTPPPHPPVHLRPQHPHTPHPSEMMLSRLERLEHLLDEHRNQFQQERNQWRDEKRTLSETVRVLEERVHTLEGKKGNKKAETFTTMTPMAKKKENAHHKQTQALAAENRELKSRLGRLHRRMLSMDMRLATLMKKQSADACGGGSGGSNTLGNAAGSDLGPARAEAEVEFEVEATGEQHASNNSRKHLQHQQQSSTVPSFSTPESEDQSTQQNQGDRKPSKQHVHSARSDDQGPLQVVVEQLAATTTQLTSDVQALKTQVTAVQAAQGSVFVHWGSSTCSGSSELVYSGVVGGSYREHTGAAANALCLSLTPTFVRKSPNYNALLYGAEYETEDSHDQQDPVCAVCRSQYSSTLMVPGTNVCSSGWSLLYSGYLMAGHYSHAAATQFICVDSKLEAANGSGADLGGHLLYYTKAACGTLPCPPYQQDKHITCAVCAK